jgi:hypothetical protein
MSDNNNLIERLVSDKYDEYIKIINQEIGVIQRDCINKGAYNTTACTNLTLAVYDKKIPCLIDNILDTIEQSGISPDFKHLEEIITTSVIRKLYDNAKSKVSTHLVSAGLNGTISQFHNAIDKKCEDTIQKIHTKIELLGAKQKKQNECNAPTQIKDLLWLMKNTKYWWIWLILLVFSYLTIEKIIAIIKWLIKIVQ